MSRIPCPDCDEDQTLEMLQWEQYQLEQYKEARNNLGYASTSISIGTAGNASTTLSIGRMDQRYYSGKIEIKKAPDHEYFTVINGIVNGFETCIECGRVYNPSVRQMTCDTTEKIEQLRAELLHPLEQLAEAADE